jgi:hypothetical protein
MLFCGVAAALDVKHNGRARSGPEVREGPATPAEVFGVKDRRTTEILRGPQDDKPGT